MGPAARATAVTVDVVVRNNIEAHKAATMAYQAAKMSIADGKVVRISALAVEDDRTLQQLRYYWGVVLAEISEQASIEGQRWSADAWHELCKRQFLGYEIKKIQVAGRRRKVVSRRLRSTTGLKVGPMSKYLEKVQAFAATDLGVRFSCPNWKDYVS